jgi:hypothetical protein
MPSRKRSHISAQTSKAQLPQFMSGHMQISPTKLHMTVGITMKVPGSNHNVKERFLKKERGQSQYTDLNFSKQNK